MECNREHAKKTALWDGPACPFARRATTAGTWHLLDEACA